MRVVTDSAPGAFLDRAEQLLRDDPFSTNVIVTVATRLASGSGPMNDGDRWFTIEGDDGEVLGVAMRTPPHNTFLSRMPHDAVLILAEELALSDNELPGVNGAIESTGAFANVWQRITGHSSKLVRATRMYRLVELVWPRTVHGQARRAEASRDLSVVAQWLAAFHEDALSSAPVEDWTALAKRRVNAGDIHLWQAQGEPVALAGVSGAPAGVARVGPVYTPPRWRKKGYGSSVTAAATAAALAAGAQHVVLYTDLANPISNSIYQAIGYRPDHDAEERSFK